MFGAFFVPEPLRVCLVLLTAIWWLCRKLCYGDTDQLLEVSDRNLDFYIFRASQSTMTAAIRPYGRISQPFVGQVCELRTDFGAVDHSENYLQMPHGRRALPYSHFI